ncbi:uncharacterized protein LOC127902265 [Citrus sinensis]|uniref:uncharacterized protein LOC112098027 n=1 Tax=Citrus clementina TaxID=85681 RepID=UPI000CED0CC3|nr:uncharacterized protein LOC112098027 [Citrus x clementina]XP_052297069.1 uncharacterized protein LOC127902265 [Citrus sinensis]
MQLLRNWELTKSFVLSRGIWQRDPILPYIFVLCIERLSRGINKVVREGRWKPIELARQGIFISHVFFVDDLLLLAKASVAQTQVIKDVFNTFCMSSGKKVGNSKTLTFISHNVHAADVKKIRDKLGFTTTKDLVSQISHANSMSPTETGTLSLTTISTTETSGLDSQISFSCRSDNINAIDHSGSPNLFHADLHAAYKYS